MLILCYKKPDYVSIACKDHETKEQQEDWGSVTVAGTSASVLAHILHVISFVGWNLTCPLPSPCECLWKKALRYGV